MNKLLFGTAGIPLGTPGSSTIDGIRYVKQIGLDALEIEFVRQVYLNPASAADVRLAAEETGVRLSAHAPYYLNLNASEPQKRRTSQAVLSRAGRIASLAGAENIVFHPGYYMNGNPEKVFGVVLGYLSEIEEEFLREGFSIKLSPETTGKLSQFGTLEETLSLCSRLKNARPCIDFAHLHAYSGKINTYSEFRQVIGTVSASLGKDSIQNLHLHVSGIHYGHRGELKHLTFEDSDFNYTELLRALIDSGAGGTVICESPNMEADTLILKKTYLELLTSE
ncbi:MAG: TIM barrel protein [Dehalococcoidaceae bacterium]|nr:TIM barrel protein [Dehalococcoidaceae bacterium]